MADRVERLLTMLLLEQLGTAPQSRKIDVLLRVGLKNAEIATLLGTTPAVVAQTAYASKQEKTKRKKKR
ncbi:MAG TPA: hypothetical protein VMF91_17505 [Bryobacteraceae bacterium]|nr:hypothetical protein [Bryobacteraceae bacterium]